MGERAAISSEGNLGYRLKEVRPNPTQFPRLLPAIPPIGGVIKVFYEDFVVEEIPLYEYSGRGEHLYVTIRKKNRTTLQVRDWFAKSLGVRPDDIGFAGFKDKRGVTTQTFSILGADEADLGPLEIPFEVLEVTRHKNKLRPGHLKGNAFKVVVRGAEPNSRSRAEEIARAICRSGLPNFYGGQRFGFGQMGYLVGHALLHRDPQRVVDLLLGPVPDFHEDFRDAFTAGDFDRALELLPPGRPTEASLLYALKRFEGNARAAVRRITRPMRRMYFSAYQAFLFNWSLNERLQWEPGAYAQLYEGDLACRFPRVGQQFLVENPAEVEDPGNAFPTGPMYGKKMLNPKGRQGELERAILATEKLRPESFISHVKGLKIDGTRRPYAVPIETIEIEEIEERALKLSFALPSGVYATTLLDQILGPGQVERRFDEYFREQGLPVPDLPEEFRSTREHEPEFDLEE